MAIDLLSENPRPLSQEARDLPRLRGGKSVSPSTIWRWSRFGIRGVKLETIKIGGTTCTSAAALRRFFARLSGEPATQTPPGLRNETVERALDSIGM
jgi:hypothetical protein